MVAARSLGNARPAPLDELDPATLARCRARDPVAFRAFVVRYQGAVFALLARMIGRSPALEDLAQETFLKAHAALPAFDPTQPSRLSTWLLTIATRVALDELKKRRWPSEPIEGRELAGGESPERSAARRRLGRAIENAAAQLGSEQRTAFVLFMFHGFSVEEIGLALGCPAATVRTRLYRARQRLRELLEGEHAEELGP
jgi:RNA polymerase sigma-70 factor (ECF subfamily)